MQYGCVQFDEDRPGPGWASINGEPAFRIRSIGDLRTDVQWWTSLSYDVYSASGFFKHPTLRYSGYLRSEMEQIKEEFGFTARFMKVTESTEKLSEILCRVMYLANIHFGIKKSLCDTLPRDIRSVLLGPDRKISEEINHAARSAYQTVTRCESNPMSRKGTKAVNFRKPRYRHALDVLSVPVPDEQWEFIPKKNLPPKHQIVDWLLQEERPCLVKAAVVEVPPDMAGLIAFGSGAQGERSWMTHPELVLLSRYCKMEVESVFMANAYTRLQPKFDLPKAEGMAELSIAFGLLAENYWNGMANAQPPHMGEIIYTPRASWLRACDRANMFIPAMQMHKSGVLVKSFGVGMVTVNVPFGNLPEVVEIAGDSGLMPPLHAHLDSMAQEELA